MPDRAMRQGFSVNELQRRGWSRGLIDKVLGSPDRIVPNPHYPGSEADPE